MVWIVVGLRMLAYFSLVLIGCLLGWLVCSFDVVLFSCFDLVLFGLNWLIDSLL